MRPTTTNVRRALSERLRLHSQGAPASGEPGRRRISALATRLQLARNARLRRLFGPARISPYQLRRSLLW
jgi:hypothetical protein